MTHEEKQTAIQWHADIILATLDYLLAKNGGSIVFDKQDVIAEHYEQQKLQTGKYYQRSQLDMLQQQLTRLTQGLQNRVDLNFAGYIKEKTGYGIDIFEYVRKRVDAIIARNEIQNKQEYDDVGVMLHYYHQTQADEALVVTLQALHLDYHKQMIDSPASRKKQSGYKEVIRTPQEDGTIIESITISTGPKPKHLVEAEAISPDGKRKLRVTEWGDGKHASTYVTIMFPTASGGIYGANGIHPGVKASWKDNSTIVIELPKDIPTHTQHKEIRSFEDVIAIEYIQH